MIKKLYTIDKDNPDEVDKGKGKSKSEKMESAMTNRSVFSYKYFRLGFLKYFEHKLCCCCKAKSKRHDFLFRDAKKKLNEEMDLLEIIKKLRVFKFASDCTLKPRQRNLVAFFKEF